MNPGLRWALINLTLPLAPFALRVFMDFMGPVGTPNWSSIAELPELLFYSIVVCIAILNLNLDKNRTNLESLIRLFLQILLILDFVTLALIYRKGVGLHVWKFTVVAAIIPALIAPFYRKVFEKKRNT